MRPTRVHVLLFVLAVLVILVATLAPGPRDVDFPCPTCADTLLGNAIANVLLYAPLGGVAAMLGWRWFGAILLGAALSGGIESLQLWIPGRNAAVLDVVTNTTGAGLGFLVVATSQWWLRPPRRAHRRLAVGAGLTFLAAGVVTAALLQPAPTRSQTYAQWTAEVAGLAIYPGRLLSAAVGDEPVPQGRVANPDRVRELLEAGTSLHLQLVTGPPTAGLAPVFSISDTRYRQLVMVGVEQHDIVLRLRRRGASYRLSQPDLRLPGALAAFPPGATVTLEVDLTAPTPCLLLDGGTHCAPPLTVGAGWSLIASPPEARPGARLALNALWLAALALPLGLWSRRDPASVTGIALAAAGLLALPLVLPVAPPHPADVLGAATGFLAGVATARSARRGAASDPCEPAAVLRRRIDVALPVAGPDGDDGAARERESG